MSIADRHGISVDALEDIISRHWSQKLTDEEREIKDELKNELEKLPESSSSADIDKVYNKIAEKYGISHDELLDIWFRNDEN